MTPSNLMMGESVFGKPLVSVRDIADGMGLSLPMVREMVNRPDFPAPCAGGPRSRRWLGSAVTMYWHEQSQKPHTSPFTAIPSHSYLRPASGQ